MGGYTGAICVPCDGNCQWQRDHYRLIGGYHMKGSPHWMQLKQILNMSSLVELIQQSANTSWIGIADVLGIVFLFHASTVDRKYDCIGWLMHSTSSFAMLEMS